MPGGIWICFFAFWLLNMFVIWRGIETIKFLESVSAPFMLGVGLLLLWWIAGKAGGLGPVLSAPSKFGTTGEFLRFFIPALTGMVGFWATVALNIPDFTRYAKYELARFQQPAGLLEIGHDDVGRALFQNLAKSPAHIDVLAAADRRAGGSPHFVTLSFCWDVFMSR